MPPSRTEHPHEIVVDRGNEPVYADAMAQTSTIPTKRLVLRAVLTDVSPIVARVIAVPDHLEVHDLHEVFLTLLGWTQDLGFIVRIRAREFNSFRRKTRGTRLRDFALRRQETSRDICDTLDLWEWEIRVLDIEPVGSKEVDIACLTGRGAAPCSRRNHSTHSVLGAGLVRRYMMGRARSQFSCEFLR
ncbi:MAG: plasmid pRiA4b ORF-3 family protein [Nitrospira sp.]|nr:plasmid pRiA4b ORF-3 family protein [Nitrospira sp.]MDH4371192.1 plasmid pRiA4b ORF-3 family protein [Nitrospira sp.]